MYNTRIAKLAFDVVRASDGAAVDRLERIYDEIYIDEVQDLVGNDLDILETLLKSRIELTLVGDVRQSILRTSRSDNKNRKVQGIAKIDWFRSMEEMRLCELEYCSSTWRCNQTIIDFADSVIPDRFGLPRTTSHQDEVTGHDGVFLVAPSDVPAYLETYRPVCYRDSKRTPTIGCATATNFGLSKGVTVDRVFIYPTGPIRDFLKSGKPLIDTSACKLYVAATRAKHSVAFMVENPQQYSLPQWTP